MKRSTRASSKTGEKASEDPQPQKEVEPPRKSARVMQARKANPRVTWNPKPAFWQGIHVQIPLNHDCGKLKFKIYGKEDIKKALTNLDRHDAWREVLHAIDVDTDSPGYKLFKSYFIRPKFPSHLRPEPITELTNVVSGSNSEQLYLENEAHALEFVRYLMLNGGWALRGTRQDGNCFFSALRRNLAVPFEFTNTHLRRWLVFKMAYVYPDFFFSIMRGPIAEQYGLERYTPEELARQQEEGLAVTESMLQAQKLPGPFSFKSYLQYMLTGGSWGDEMMALAFSLLTQTTITLVDSKNLHEVRIRHDSLIDDVNVLLIHAGLAHYAGAVKQQNTMVEGKNTVTVHPIPVEMAKLKEDFDFCSEDPRIFEADKGDRHFQPERAWPSLPLPKVPPPKAIGTIPQGPLGEPAYMQAMSEPDKEEFKKVHVEALKFHARMLSSLGIDPVQELIKQRGLAVLQAVKKDTDHCSICDKVIKSVQRLREHIIREHCPPEFQYFCENKGCEFVAGSVGELNEHIKIHRKVGKSSELYCRLCDKALPTLARLNEHNRDKHPKPGQEWRQTCQYCYELEDGCKTIFQYKNNLKAHEQKCIYQPGGAPRFGCFFCSSDFASVVYRNDHVRKHHPNQAFD